MSIIPSVCFAQVSKKKQATLPESLLNVSFHRFFCIVRVVAFAIRAVLAASVSAAEDLNLVIADEALFAVGYFSLIYSAYNLVLDR